MAKGYEADYLQAVGKLTEIVTLQPNKSWDRIYATCALAAIAAAKGQIDYG